MHNLTLKKIGRSLCTPSPCESRRRFLSAAGSSLLLAGCAGPGALFAPQRESGYIEVPNGRLYFEAAGNGPPVVLLHAFTLDTRMWDAQFNALTERYRVIAYDARGFGRSSLPVAGQAYSHVNDLLALLDKLEARDPHLVGASMGGRFALDFAVTQPDRYRSLTLIDGVLGGWDWSPEWLASYAPVIAASQRQDIAAAKAAWLAHPVFATVRANEAVYRQLRRMVGDYSGWHFTNQDPAQHVVPPVSTRLAGIRGPILSLVGEYDMPDFHRMAQKLEADAKAQRVMVQGAGHLSSMGAAASVNERLLEFLSKTS